MFISDSLAGDGGGSATAPDLFGFFIPLILIFLVFYFLLIRPQQKKMKKHNAMLAAIKRGDKIITGGGIVENTNRILDNNQSLDIDWDAWQRPAIFNLIQELGNVPEADIRQSMNLGIGMILIINPAGLSIIQSHLSSQGEPYIRLGSVS